MKKIVITLFSLVLSISLIACQQSPTEDTGKLQEAIDKIKTKIQENLSSDKDKKTNEQSTKDNSDQNSTPDTSE